MIQKSSRTENELEIAESREDKKVYQKAAAYHDPKSQRIRPAEFASLAFLTKAKYQNSLHLHPAIAASFLQLLWFSVCSLKSPLSRSFSYISWYISFMHGSQIP
jgi:hypothetical protein